MERLRNQKILINNPKGEWLEKNYPGFLHTIFMQGLQAGVYEMNKLYPFGFQSGYSINWGREIDWYWDARELKRVRELFLQRSKKDLKFFLKIYARWEKDHKTNIAAYERADKIDFAGLNDKQLWDEFEKLYQTNIAQGATAYLADAFLSTGEQDWLVEFIKSQTGSSDPSVVNTLTAPTIPTYSNECEMGLIRIKNSIKKWPESFREFLVFANRDEDLWGKIQKHAEKYYWVENNYFAKRLNESDFARQIFDLRNSKENYSANLSENQKRKQALLAKYKNNHLSNVIKMSEMMTHMQDYRKMALVRYSAFLDLIFKEVAKRRGITIDDLYNSVEPEEKKIFLGEYFDLDELKLRAKKNFIYANPKGYVVYEGEDVAKYVNLGAFDPTGLGGSEITGVPACPGLVRGTVRVVKDARGVIIKKGDILVTNNTTPEYVPLMKRAGAIVTEQGGITTHAAIVSRELGVPCVIGTKIATKVLKDGDLVEVDAHKGVIRKI